MDPDTFTIYVWFFQQTKKYLYTVYNGILIAEYGCPKESTGHDVWFSALD
jgi:hypothetical protein